MRIAVFSYTERGRRRKERLTAQLSAEGTAAETELTPEAAFRVCDALIFIGAAGIAVRKIAPLVRDKFQDPAVVSLDEAGHFAVSLLSGHAGGANDLVRHIADLTGAVPVISTATDLNRCFAVDLFAKRNGLVITDRTAAKEFSAALLRGETAGFSSDLPVTGTLPENLVPAGEAEPGSFLLRVTARAEREDSAAESPAQTPEELAGHRTLTLIPRAFCLGVGCKKGTDRERMKAAALAFLKSAGIAPEAVAVIASIDLKKDEPAVLNLPAALGAGAERAALLTPAGLKFFTAAELNAVPGTFPASPFVTHTTGTDNVCARAAAAVFPEVMVPKQIVDGMTFALSRAEQTLIFENNEAGRGLIFITGGAFQGKHAFAEKLLRENAVSEILDAETLRKLTGPAEDLFMKQGDLSAEAYLKETADRIRAEHPAAAVLLRTEGNGVVPADRRQRAAREVNGRLACLLAERAAEVWILECGIPRRLS